MLQASSDYHASPSTGPRSPPATTATPTCCGNASTGRPATKRVTGGEMQAGVALLSDHVARFNAGVRSGDFGPMVDGFTDDAELVFEGIPVGPFRGRAAIAAAYRNQPPDD